MKHRKYSRRTVTAAGVILVTMVCAVLGVSAMRGIEDGTGGNGYADNFPQPEAQKRIKGIELREALRDYDKKNIAEAYVLLSDMDGEITDAHILIICQEQDPGSEMQSGIRTLAAEELGLDIQNIFVEYMDVESFTSEEDV